MPNDVRMGSINQPNSKPTRYRKQRRLLSKKSCRSKMKDTRKREEEIYWHVPYEVLKLQKSFSTRFKSSKNTGLGTCFEVHILCFTFVDKSQMSVVCRKTFTTFTKRRVLVNIMQMCLFHYIYTFLIKYIYICGKENDS